MVFEVGIIGYGSSARTFHIPFIQASPAFRLHSILQRHSKLQKPDAAKDLLNVRVYRSLDDLLQDDQVQVVIITTPPASHLDLATAALKANKHVVVEKPFTPTFAEAQELVSLAREKKLLLTVYQNRRWDSDFLTLKSLKEEGTLGRIVEVESHFDRYRPCLPVDTWKAHPSAGNGALYDLGTHLIDQIVHLFGLPTRVTGVVGSQRTSEVNKTGLDDSFTVLMHYEDGMLATVKAAVISPEQKQLRFWVRGDRASLKMYGFDLQEAQLKRGARPSEQGFGIEEHGENNYATLTTVNNDGATFTTKRLRSSSVVEHDAGTYGQFYRKLALALRSGDDSQLPVAVDQVAQVIRLIELAYESSNLGIRMEV
ncbi:NAD binding Rossmann fold oxidoreductase [Xylariales sp. PMI_506]|nr:NAD binding Rossmann fold oxidoreductase [Xylariales sp. PMI_506]